MLKISNIRDGLLLNLLTKLFLMPCKGLHTDISYTCGIKEKVCVYIKTHFIKQYANDSYKIQSIS